MDESPFGLLAGSGRLPEIVAEQLSDEGRSVVACHLDPDPSETLRSTVDSGRVFSPEQFGDIPEYLNDRGVEDLVMVGTVDRSLLFDDDRLEDADQVVSERVESQATNQDESLLETAVEILEAYGIRVRGLNEVMEDNLTPTGHLAGPELRPEDQKTLDFLGEIGPFLSDHDVGQTILGKRQSVVAVEAAEGTNETIRRAGELAGPGTVMLKVARSDQDFRLDVPVFGQSTLRNLADVEASALAVEAERTLWIERQECRKIADDAGISVLGWERPEVRGTVK